MVSPCLKYFAYHTNIELEDLCNILGTDVVGKIAGLLANENEDIIEAAVNCLSEFANHSKSVLYIF